MNQEGYHRLISGQSSGLGAALLRFVLGGAAKFYSIAVRLRNFSYSKEWLKIHRANAPVISIGNITTGGTGKTPLVIWICRFLQNKNVPCAILTRGYKARGTRDEGRATRDEPAILAKSCPEAKVIVNPDRVAGAAEAVDVAWPSWPRFHLQNTGRMPVPPTVLIMDDGFQHRRLGRDLDIVTIDATRPFGYGRILPAGLLREPLTSLKRANAVVITRCDQATEAKLTQIEEKLRQVNPDMIIARSIHAAVCVTYPEPPVIPAKAGIQKSSETMDSCLRRNDNVEHLKGKRIFAFCGIGNPDAFLNTIKALGAELVGSNVYNDHHHYTNDCLSDICKQAAHLKADLILTTQKDWTKIARLAPAKKDIPLAYLAIEIKFLAGEDKLRGLIEDTLASKIPKK